jgi:hypothetical protein
VPSYASRRSAIFRVPEHSLSIHRPSPHGKCAGATRVASDAGPDTSTFRMVDLLLLAFKGKKNLLTPLG